MKFRVIKAVKKQSATRSEIILQCVSEVTKQLLAETAARVPHGLNLN